MREVRELGNVLWESYAGDFARVTQTIQGEWKGKGTDAFEGREESCDLELGNELNEKTVVHHISES